MIQNPTNYIKKPLNGFKNSFQKIISIEELKEIE